MIKPVDRFFAIWCVIWLMWFVLFLIPALWGYVVVAMTLGAVSFLLLWMIFCNGMAELEID